MKYFAFQKRLEMYWIANLQSSEDRIILKCNTGKIMWVVEWGTQDMDQLGYKGWNILHSKKETRNVLNS